VVRNASMASFAFGLDNGINVSGARSQESIITLDGAPMVRTRSNGTSVGVADVDSTSQVQILTTSYPAEYGRASGGQIRMIPKSGTSQFHGAAYEYFPQHGAEREYMDSQCFVEPATQPETARVPV